MQEIWKEYKTYYNNSSKIRSSFMVSNLGNIKGECYNGKKIEIKINGKGKRSLSNGSCGQIFKIVWESFNGPIPKGYCVHHIDENPLNDRLDNLQLLTNEEHVSYHHKGKHLSKEAREKISKAAKLRNPMSEDTKRKIGESSKGRKHTEETKEKIRQKRLGRTLSKEAREKISKANKGRKSRLGAKLTKETKEKISQGLKKHFKNNIKK